MSLIKEIEIFGEVRCDGCILTLNKGRHEYLMRDSDALFGGNRHTVSADPSVTDDERLEAHWDGFRAAAHARRVAR